MRTEALENQTEATEGKEAKAERAKELTEAFQAFTQKTLLLEKAYTQLKGKFESVNLALEQTNRVLNDKVGELARTTEYLNSILDHMTQGILFVRLDGTVATCNPAAEQILGLVHDELVGQPFWSKFDDDFFGFSLKDALISTEAEASVQVALKQTDGSATHLDITTTFVLEGTPDHRGVIILIRDVTEMRHLQLLAERNDRIKELGEMAACVAHEIRNPLGGIKGFASLLVRDLEDKPDTQRMAQYIVDGTGTLNRLVSRVLHYARPIDLQLKPTLVAPLLDEVCHLVEADSQLSQGITLKREFTDADAASSLDPEIFKPAILNLIVNAVQAMPEGGEVGVGVSRDQDTVVITVRDHGLGIAEEIRERIFTPFFTTKDEGTGFGLSEVHRVVQTHGGTIEVESEIDKGSCFSISLPRVKSTSKGTA